MRSLLCVLLLLCVIIRAEDAPDTRPPARVALLLWEQAARDDKHNAPHAAELREKAIGLCPKIEAAKMLYDAAMECLRSGDMAGGKSKLLAANELAPGISSPVTDESLRALAQAFERAHDARRANDASNRPRTPRTGE